MVHAGGEGTRLQTCRAPSPFKTWGPVPSTIRPHTGVTHARIIAAAGGRDHLLVVALRHRAGSHPDLWGDEDPQHGAWEPVRSGRVHGGHAGRILAGTRPRAARQLRHAPAGGGNRWPGRRPANRAWLAALHVRQG